MEKQEFAITVNAPKEKVWTILWDEETYPIWTAPFCEGSKAVTDWEKGSKVHFLSPENSGMVSTIAEKIPNEFMSFKHIGVVKDGVEDYNSEGSQEWVGALENYRLTSVNGATELHVDMDITASHKDYFLTTW